MSRLLFTETGRVLPHANEEVTRWRWARKILRLPTAASRAELWLYVRCYLGNKFPLDIRVNGRQATSLQPPPKRNESSWEWRRVSLDTKLLRRGDNAIELRCQSSAMNAWMLGIENGHRDPKSYLSIDRGRTWRNSQMGVSGVLRGEYLVRLRVHEAKLSSTSPPSILYEDSKYQRVSELREIIPARIRKIREPWQQLLALRTWVAKGWKYQAYGSAYAPWDPWTVLAWKRENWGHGYGNPIAMCVHYGMVFTSLASALGHAARGVAITASVNGPSGHFMTEIWDKKLSKWILHDPNFDMHYETGQPMSGIELADKARARVPLGTMMRRGSGFPSSNARLVGLMKEILATGKAFAALGVWRLNDVISNPSSAPPAHGSVIYCETDFVWYVTPGQRDVDMFPYQTGEREYFSRSPRHVRSKG